MRSQGARRAREFEAFVAGAAGRLLQTATLLTAEPPDDNPRARRLLTLRPRAHVRVLGPAARRGPVRPGPPAPRRPLRARGLAPVRRPRPGPPARPAAPWPSLTPQERLILVLRLYEGVAEEQAAALLGLPAERVHAICDRATATLLHPPARGRHPTMAGEGGAVMSRRDREAAVRQIMERTPPPVPPDLYADAVRRGSRMLRRRTAARRLMWLLLAAAVVAFVVWALMARPWVEPPSETTPPLTGW